MNLRLDGAWAGPAGRRSPRSSPKAWDLEPFVDVFRRRGFGAGVNQNRSSGKRASIDRFLAHGPCPVAYYLGRSPSHARGCRPARFVDLLCLCVPLVVVGVGDLWRSMCVRSSHLSSPARSIPIGTRIRCSLDRSALVRSLCFVLSHTERSPTHPDR